MAMSDTYFCISYCVFVFSFTNSYIKKIISMKKVNSNLIHKKHSPKKLNKYKKSTKKYYKMLSKSREPSITLP